MNYRVLGFIIAGSAIGGCAAPATDVPLTAANTNHNPVQATIVNQPDIDPNGDGVIELGGLLRSGTILNRPYDGITQIEAGHYIVPSNIVFADRNGDGALDPQPLRARVVVVIRDNLTYLFKADSDEVLGVFPNGTGRPGANTVASLRRINVMLDANWGQQESIRENLEPYPGTQEIPNYFGIYTLGTRYYIDDDVTHDIDTFQEVHGTFTAKYGSVDGVSLLGTEISGGCTRHSNPAITFIKNNVRANDLILTVETAQDDAIDDPFNIYNRTRLAARLPLVEVPFNNVQVGYQRLTRPENFIPRPIDLNNITTATWANFDQLPLPKTYPVAEHPYTTARYEIIPCGSETMLITAAANNVQVMQNGNAILSRRLLLPEFIQDENQQPLRVSDFYTPRTVTLEEIHQNRMWLSGGADSVGAFEILMDDLAYQYAAYVANKRVKPADPYSAEMRQRVAYLDDARLRHVQLVTGLIPTKYSIKTPESDGNPADRFAALRNRTLIHSMMNVFFGARGNTYELEPLAPTGQEAYHAVDMTYYAPSLDHEMTRTTAPARSLEQLLRQAITDKKPAIFRITNYRKFTTSLSYNSFVSAAHYFALVPEYSNPQAGYVAIQDSMHPHAVLLVPWHQLKEIFSTVTIAP